jgi:hypothetical protein
MADNKNNPRNPNSPLFQRLTRLFSGPIVNYRAQQVRNNRKYSVDKYGSKFRSVGGQSFKRKSYNPYESISTAMMNNYNRVERYADFDQMEFMPELASALDIYADEITTHSEFHRSLIIDCQNEEIKDILETLFHKVLNIDANLFGWVRSMCKYGDFFGYLDIDEEIGIKSFIGLPVSEIERMEGTDQSNPNYVQYQWNTGGLTFENWQMAHFRVLGNDKYVPYGTSVLDPGRRIWRQLTLLEDAMIAYRVVRSPSRKQFKIDVGGIPPEEVEQYMQKIITMMKRHQVVDDTSGRVDLRYNPLSIEEDYYIPTRNGQASVDISQVQGDTWGTAIDDIKYLQNKLFAAIKIPMSYLIRGEGGTEEQAALSQKDIRFARTIQRIQRAVVAELDKMATIHLYTLGYRGNDLINFNIKLHNPSRIASMQELETLKSKLEIASTARSDVYSNRWIAKNILGISEQELIRNTREKFHDKQIETALAKIATEQGEGLAAETLTGGGFGGVGDIGLGGDTEVGGEIAAPETEVTAGLETAPEPAAPEPATPAPEPEAGGGEDVLLATPEGGGKKPDKPAAIYTEYEDGSHTTKGSKGKKYWSVKHDKREKAGRKESWGATKQRKPRDINKALSIGTLVKENKSNYSEEFENKMSSLNEEMDRILSEDL